MKYMTDVNKTQPEITGSLISGTLLFISNDRLYCGYYHENGCFYSNDERFAAKTDIAEAKYDPYQLPTAHATWWIKMSDALFLLTAAMELS